jgi:hypothetical protein
MLSSREDQGSVVSRGLGAELQAEASSACTLAERMEARLENVVLVGILGDVYVIEHHVADRASLQ